MPSKKLYVLEVFFGDFELIPSSSISQNSPKRTLWKHQKCLLSGGGGMAIDLALLYMLYYRMLHHFVYV